MTANPSLEARLRSHIDILAGLIGERNSRRPTALDAARAYLTKQLIDMGLQVSEHRYIVPAREAVNLEITIIGNRPNKPYLIVGAHYDTAPTTPGADDNTSAVAALIEIIRALKGAKIRRSLRCVFYDCEEPPHFATPHMGSFQDAKRTRERGDAVLGMICLESIGFFPRRVDSRVWRPRFIKCLDWILGGKYIVIVSDFRSIPFGLPFVFRFLTSGLFLCLPAAVPMSLGIIDLSDHRSYWTHGFRALMVTNTAMFRNPNYHKPSDLPGTLDHRQLTRLTRMLIRSVRRTCG